MAGALALGRRALGSVAPNPAVGCVLVRDGVVVGRGWTRPGGRPHAEADAVERAGARARGATAYVSLEPCAHDGRGPSCADALIAAGVARVVIAVRDPDPRTDGKGLARLDAAGIAVEEGVLAREAAESHLGFLTRLDAGRPSITLKVATSLDGRIATARGESKWITGEEARSRVQLLRVEHDAILVGAATAIADDPDLSVRLPGLEDRIPVAIVADRRLRTPLTHRLVRAATTRPVWFLTSEEGADPERRRIFQAAGVELIDVGLDGAGRLDLTEAMVRLGEKGLTRLLVEGGGHLAASLVMADLIDRIHWFRSPLVIGGDGVPALAGLGVHRLADATRFRGVRVERVGHDVLESLARRE